MTKPNVCKTCGHLPSEGKPYPWKPCKCICHRFANRVMELFDLCCNLVVTLDAIKYKQGSAAERQIKFAHDYEVICGLIADMLFQEVQITGNQSVDKWGFLGETELN